MARAGGKDPSRLRRGTRRGAGRPDGVPGGVKVLALDHGSARTGVAVSDPTGTIARPLPAIARVDSPAGRRELDALIAREEPSRIVVGEPRSMSGERGAQARAAAGFAGRLRARTAVPVDLWDERLTTVEAAPPRPRGRLAGRPRQPGGLRAARGLPGGAAVSRRRSRQGLPPLQPAPSARGAGAHPPVAGGDRGAGGGRGPGPGAGAVLGRSGPGRGRHRRRLPVQRLLIREGLRREDIAALLDQRDLDLGRAPTWRPPPPARAAGALAKTDEAHLARGLPVPGHLRHHAGHDGRAQLVDAQVQAYKDNTANIDYSYARSKNLTRFDVLILASIIEREVALPEGAPDRRGRHLQPPAGQDAARHRRHHPVRDRRRGRPT